VHPSIEARFKRLISASGQFHYQGYLPDADAHALFSRTRFSVFASDDEGFGLPIAESLAHGVPCLTGNFGAMAENAHGGGCLTVDVKDQRALSAGLLRLMREDALVARLRGEIAVRRFRTWREYAASLVGDMQATSDTEAELRQQMSDKVVAAIQEGLGNSARRMGSYFLVGMDDGRFNLAIDAGQAPARPFRQGESAGASAFDVTAIDARSLTATDDLLVRATRSSVCVLEGREMLGAFVQRVQEQGCPQMLPDILCADTDEGGLPAVGRSISQKLTERNRRIEIAGRERLLCRLACSVRASREPSLPLLSIVVSTYNRARFVEENVRWLLHVLRQFPKDVHLTVVDNASTDDTADRLAKFARNSRLTLITNPVNLGMLGNLRACASLIGARHVWITGDDDFIVPSGLAEIYAALKANPEVPFAFVNFGVYRRSAPASAPCPRPTGCSRPAPSRW
jgi:hypothetical protein